MRARLPARLGLRATRGTCIVCHLAAACSVAHAVDSPLSVLPVAGYIHTPMRAIVFLAWPYLYNQMYGRFLLLQVRLLLPPSRPLLLSWLGSGLLSVHVRCDMAQNPLLLRPASKGTAACCWSARGVLPPPATPRAACPTAGAAADTRPALPLCVPPLHSWTLLAASL